MNAKLKIAPLRALDLFCGIGGSSAGARMAGADVVAAVDMWELARETYVENFENAQFYLGSAEACDLEKIASDIKGGIQLILASPECTSHTCAKGNAKRSEDSRKTAFEVVRYAKALKPRWIIVENVIQMRTWRRYKNWIGQIKALGYHIREQVLNAADFGVPQSRRRLFITCDLEVEPPKISSSNRTRKMAASFIHQNGFRFSNLRSEGRALATLERADRAIAALGNNKPFLIVYYGSDGSGGWQKLQAPLRTITTLDRFAYVRPLKNGHQMRMLQVPELKRAMGFPADYKINHGTRRDRIKLLGNAVCPPLMKVIVQKLVRTK
jgi:DNA (cytosine-5)-methyltransferase 1